MPKRVKTTEDMSKEAALVWERHVLISAGKFEGGTPYPPLLNPEPAKEEPEDWGRGLQKEERSDEDVDAES